MKKVLQITLVALLGSTISASAEPANVWGLCLEAADELEVLLAEKSAHRSLLANRWSNIGSPTVEVKIKILEDFDTFFDLEGRIHAKTQYVAMCTKFTQE